MDVPDWEPRVVNQLLEYSFRYVSEVTADAEEYKKHAGKQQQLDADDIRVAVKLKDAQVMRPPDRDELIALAAERNKEELPPVEQHEYGIRLPPPEQQLTALNYQIGRKRAAQEEPAQARQKKAR